ncbi:hypothetical protein AB3662_29710 [Sorangium cellulosum]|uniref:hypothetical protein n=1 Tax=Sorangium cellulosum TaxID=56 RepID=UPI003D9A2727
MEITCFGTRLAALAALAWGSACGGHVVVDGTPDGSGGAGAASSAATSTSASWATTSASAITTGAGGGDLAMTCLSYCELFGATCARDLGECSEFCGTLLSQAPECNELLVPVFDCARDVVGQCDFPARECSVLLPAYETCAFDAG